MNDALQDASYNRSACTECQRRKQKCNREWPCNHCQKRKVASKCRFSHANPSSEKPPKSQDAKRKRQASHDFDDRTNGSSSGSDDILGLESMGYMSSALFARLNIDDLTAKADEVEDEITVARSPPLDRALRLLPVRSYMDALIQSFFNNVNFHYYILYPPVFLQDYHSWWDKRAQGRPISLQWTCLLISVCACATQHLDAGKQRSVELDMGDSAEELAERYHNAARELGNAIPGGHYHMYNVQRLLHWCYWYKSEARFPEAWHVLSSAVREAQELNFHRDPVKDPLTEFDREMRRRLWCIMNTWDWQISSGLCRPTIIDRSECRVDLPSLTLEDYSPSPLTHMKLQSELIGELYQRFKAPKHIVSPVDVQQYQKIVEDWMARFPPVYSLSNPDKTPDPKHSWVTFHRYYIWTMGYLMIMNAIRPYMAQQYDPNSRDIELQIRGDGVQYCLQLMSILEAWTNYASHRDGRFHFIIFSLFDTAAVLCTAIIKDTHYSIPQRHECIIAIDSAVEMLRRLTELSTTAKASYEILVRLAKRVPRDTNHSHDHHRKRVKKIPEAAAMALKTANHFSGHASLSMVPEPVYMMQHPRQDSTSPNNFVFVESSTSGSSPQSDVAGIDELASSSTSYSIPPSIEGQPAIHIPCCNPLVGVGGVHLLPSTTMYSDMPAIPVSDSVDEYGFVTITDHELGDLPAIWDWQSLNLDFINSQNPIHHPPMHQPYV